MTIASCFKAYDVRGTYPEQLNSGLAWAIGRALVEFLSPARVVIGRDCRLSGPDLCAGLVKGLRSLNVEVVDIGLCGTEEIYYATFAHGFDAGIMVTGSHNPRNDNGLKFVRKGAVPISGDSGLFEIRDKALAYYEQGLLEMQQDSTALGGEYVQSSYRDDYVKFLLDYVKIEPSAKLKIHADAGNGCAGLVLQQLLPHLPFEVSCANMQPDGNFPNGIPNPLLPERREATSKAVLLHGADMGIAWDGDFDRCFFYDAKGNFIEGYYLVGLLAKSLLGQFPKSNIIHDLRLIWNTQDMVADAGGTSVNCKAGHAFIKEKMREVDAVYGGEMSAHHYFRDFAYCDSGMLPWLLVAQLVVKSGKSLAELVGDCMQKYPCSGEINRKVADPSLIMAKIKKIYEADALSEDSLDGLSMEFANWRFNLRASNTEPLLRLNVETRADEKLMREKTEELLKLIDEADVN